MTTPPGSSTSRNRAIQLRPRALPPTTPACDSPFKTEALRAAWLAGVLTPIARFAFRVPAPLFLMDANVRGAGKP
jgi:hypothetical protein